jgi:hypothetical protein
MDRAGAVTAQGLTELELGRQRVGGCGLGLEGNEPSSIDGTKVRVVRELLLAFRAKLHASLPLIT